MQPHLHPDDYQRMRDAAKRHALQLRQEAIRDAHAWVVRGLLRLTRRVLHALRTRSAPANPSTTPSTLKAVTPCPPLS
ncbi:hypothetical protein [Acidovorax sp. NB1]|uniref:hypothetical protein n=1 Tax=Acidovorax sp. NB1 TaxID=1943571 RepID=UPI0010E64DDD|nr:hypothetical protein [Acidovorax sp. NB1]GDY36709.1 hypothetical protein ACINB_26010 [Acidovorax sp. NB1]